MDDPKANFGGRAPLYESPRYQFAKHEAIAEPKVYPFIDEDVATLSKFDSPEKKYEVVHKVNPLAQDRRISSLLCDSKNESKELLYESSKSHLINVFERKGESQLTREQKDTHRPSSTAYDSAAEEPVYESPRRHIINSSEPKKDSQLVVEQNDTHRLSSSEIITYDSAAEEPVYESPKRQLVNRATERQKDRQHFMDQKHVSSSGTTLYDSAAEEPLYESPRRHIVNSSEQKEDGQHALEQFYRLSSSEQSAYDSAAEKPRYKSPRRHIAKSSEHKEHSQPAHTQECISSSEFTTYDASAEESVSESPRRDLPTTPEKNEEKDDNELALDQKGSHTLAASNIDADDYAPEETVHESPHGHTALVEQKDTHTLAASNTYADDYAPEETVHESPQGHTALETTAEYMQSIVEDDIYNLPSNENANEVSAEYSHSEYNPPVPAASIHFESTVPTAPLMAATSMPEAGAEYLQDAPYSEKNTEEANFIHDPEEQSVREEPNRLPSHQNGKSQKSMLSRLFCQSCQTRRRCCRRRRRRRSGKRRHAWNMWLPKTTSGLDGEATARFWLRQTARWHFISGAILLLAWLIAYIVFRETSSFTVSSLQNLVIFRLCALVGVAAAAKSCKGRKLYGLKVLKQLPRVLCLKTVDVCASILVWFALAPLLVTYESMLHRSAVTMLFILVFISLIIDLFGAIAAFSAIRSLCVSLPEIAADEVDTDIEMSFFDLDIDDEYYNLANSVYNGRNNSSYYNARYSMHYDDNSGADIV